MHRPADQRPPLNPLTTILTMAELFEFASQEVSNSQIFQCTIIRDKRGIDRSLYPTYFMYLQMMIGGEDGDGESVVQGQKEQDARAKVMRHLPGGGREAGTGTRATRQVFLLCGRRRKKSKTYLIGLDPFDISRINCVAKLKSNVIGTQFRAVRYAVRNSAGESRLLLFYVCLTPSSLLPYLSTQSRQRRSEIRGSIYHLREL